MRNLLNPSSALREAEDKTILQHYLPHLQPLNLGEKIHSSKILFPQSFWAFYFMTWCIVPYKYLFFFTEDKEKLDHCLVVDRYTVDA